MSLELKSLLALAAIGWAVPLASASQNDRQTPENAQRFIVRALTSARTTSLARFNVRGEPIGNYVSANIVELEADGECVTNVDATYAIPREHGIAQMAIAWEDVTEVRQDGPRIVLRVRGDGGVPAVVHLSSETIAARVAYAMEFLRSHCDPGAETGF